MAKQKSQQQVVGDFMAYLIQQRSPYVFYDFTLIEDQLQIRKRICRQELSAADGQQAPVHIPENIDSVVFFGDLLLGDAKGLSGLPDNLAVEGEMKIWPQKAFSLPANLYVKRDLDLRTANIKRIPDDMLVRGHLILVNSKINAVPEGVCHGYVAFTEEEYDNLPNGIDPDEFAEELGLDALPEELARLLALQNRTGFECYSQGFGLMAIDKEELSGWTEDEALLDKLYPFAQANGSGSIYAIWDNDASTSFSDKPILVFGDEGDAHVAADNLKQLLHLLSFDSEIAVDEDGIAFYKDKDSYEASEDLGKLTSMNKKYFGLSKLSSQKEVDAMVQQTQEKHKAAFEAWLEGSLPT